MSSQYNVKKIDKNLLSSHYISKLLISEGIEELQEGTFSNLKSVVKVTIPGSVKTISANCFCNCDRMQFLELQKGIQEIGENAFKGCKSLTRVFLPETITYIADTAFDDCGSNLGFSAEYDSYARLWCEKYNKTVEILHPKKFFVQFFNEHNKVLHSEYVEYKKAPKYIPTITPREGYTFERWDENVLEIRCDTNAKPIITKNITYEVTFYRHNNSIYKLMKARPGADLSSVLLDNYTDSSFTYIFNGWDKDVSNIQENTKAHPIYVKIRNENMKFFKQ